MKVNIFSIGFGGTGGCFFARMARFLADYSNPSIKLCFHIIDGDHVELKNLSRQPFSEDDIGKNKAVALAALSQELFDINVKSYPEYLTPENATQLIQYPNSSSKDISNDILWFIIICATLSIFFLCLTNLQ